MEEYDWEDVEKLEKFNATLPGKDVVLTDPALPTKAFLDLWIGTLVRLLSAVAMKKIDDFLGCFGLRAASSFVLWLAHGLLLGCCRCHWRAYALHVLP